MWMVFESMGLSSSCGVLSCYIPGKDFHRIDSCCVAFQRLYAGIIVVSTYAQYILHAEDPFFVPDEFRCQDCTQCEARSAVCVVYDLYVIDR